MVREMKGEIKTIKADIPNVDRTESGNLIYWKDYTINSIRRRIPE